MKKEPHMELKKFEMIDSLNSVFGSLKKIKLDVNNTEKYYTVYKVNGLEVLFPNEKNPETKKKSEIYFKTMLKFTVSEAFAKFFFDEQLKMPNFKERKVVKIFQESSQIFFTRSYPTGAGRLERIKMTPVFNLNITDELEEAFKFVLESSNSEEIQKYKLRSIFGDNREVTMELIRYLKKEMEKSLMDEIEKIDDIVNQYLEDRIY